MGVVLWTLCGMLLVAAGSSASIVFPDRRSPSPQQLAGRLLSRESYTGIELVVRLNRLERAMAIHHMAIDRRLNAILVHLATMASQDRQAAQIVEQARQERQQAAALAEEARQERRQAAALAEEARADRRKTAAALGQLTAAVRGQSRALQAVGAAALTNSTTELHRARDEDGKRHRQLSRKVDHVYRLAARTNTAVTEQTAALSDGLSRLQAQLQRTGPSSPSTTDPAPLDTQERLSADISSLLKTLSSLENSTARFIPALDERVARVNQQSERRSEQLGERLTALRGGLLTATDGLEHLQDRQILQSSLLNAAMMVLGGLTEGQRYLNSSLADLTKDQRFLNQSLTEGQSSLQRSLAEVTEDQRFLNQSLAEGQSSLERSLAEVTEGQRSLNQSLAEGQLSLNQSLTEGQSSLERSLAELTEGRNSLAQSLTEGQNSLAQSLTEGQNSLAQSLTDGQTSLAQSLTEGQNSLENSLAELSEGQRSLNQSLSEGQRSLNQSLSEGQRSLDSSLTAIQAELAVLTERDRGLPSSTEQPLNSSTAAEEPEATSVAEESVTKSPTNPPSIEVTEPAIGTTTTTGKPTSLLEALLWAAKDKIDRHQKKP